MARFTETDQAAQLLQQILTLPVELQPAADPAPASPSIQGAWGGTTDDVGAVPLPLGAVGELESAQVIPPSRVQVGESIVRELVVTRVGQVQLTLHLPPGHSLPADGETVGQFLQRVVRPLPPSDQSTT